MSAAKHRIIASAILIVASLGLVAVGRTMIQDSPRVAALRRQLAGKWVATRVEVSDGVQAQGAAAAQTTVEFAGQHVQFANLIDAPHSEGVYNLGDAGPTGKIDFKLSTGWMLGIYEIKADRLTLCVNSLKLPEQLGVPAQGRPERLLPSPGRFVYEFRKALP